MAVGKESIKRAAKAKQSQTNKSTLAKQTELEANVEIETKPVAVNKNDLPIYLL